MSRRKRNPLGKWCLFADPRWRSCCWWMNFWRNPSFNKLCWTFKIVLRFETQLELQESWKMLKPPTRWCKVTFWSLTWRSLNLWNGHLTIPKDHKELPGTKHKKTQGAWSILPFTLAIAALTPGGSLGRVAYGSTASFVGLSAQWHHFLWGRGKIVPQFESLSICLLKSNRKKTTEKQDQVCSISIIYFGGKSFWRVSHASGKPPLQMLFTLQVELKLDPPASVKSISFKTGKAGGCHRQIDVKQLNWCGQGSLMKRQLIFLATLFGCYLSWEGRTYQDHIRSWKLLGIVWSIWYQDDSGLDPVCWKAGVKKHQKRCLKKSMGENAKGHVWNVDFQGS